MDETAAYYTELSKSERKTPIQYINIYIYIYIAFRKMVIERKTPIQYINIYIYSI